MVKRIVVLAMSALAGLILIGTLLLWAAGASWLPTKGKTVLIRALEANGTLQVSIGSLTYQPFRGFQLERLEIMNRATREVWASAPTMTVQLNWLALLGRQLAIRSRVPLTQPLHTIVSLSARYGLQSRSLEAEALTSDMPIRSFGMPLSRYVPTSLTDGTIRLRVHLSQTAEGHVTVTGRCEGTHVVWTDPAWRLTGDLAVSGTAKPPADSSESWTYQGELTLLRATLDGMAGVPPVSNLIGTARLTPDRIEITHVTGRFLDSTWNAEGSVTTGGHPAIEALVTSQLHLAPLAKAVPGFGATWRPDGAAQLRAVCRAALNAPWPVDCLACADVQHATLAGDKLIHPLQDITGRARYDLLTRELSFESLTGHLAEQPITISGVMTLAESTRLALDITGMLPLDALPPWLPAGLSASGLNGSAALDVQLRGSVTAPIWLGSIELHEGTAQWAQPAINVEHVNGSVRLANNQVDVLKTSLILNHEPLTLTASVSPLNPPHVHATIGFPQGQLQVSSRITPQAIVLDDSRFTLAATDVRLNGSVGLGSDQPSTVKLSGLVEWSELNRVPFLKLPQLASWQLEGATSVDARFRGRFADWIHASIEGRLAANRLRIAHIPFEQITATIEQDRGILRLRIPSSICAGGKCWGELTIEHHQATHDVLLQADIVNLQLEQLAQTLPARQKRGATGTASAHALLNGTWERRASWLGQGWLNASGDQLGDMPLLDALFRGMFGALADRLGLEGLRRAKVTQGSAHWQLRQEQISTEDLRIGGLAGDEPVAIYAHGTIGLDHALDLVIEPELSEGTVLRSPATSVLASTVLKAAGQLDRLRRLIGRHRITGTLEKPSYRFEFGTQEVLKEIVPSTGDLIQQLLHRAR